MGHVARREPRIQGTKRENISFGKNISQNQNFETLERERERERRESMFPLAISQVSSIGSRRV